MPPEMIRRMRLPWSTEGPWANGYGVISHYQLWKTQARWREARRSCAEHFPVKYRKNTGTRWHRYDDFHCGENLHIALGASVHLVMSLKIIPFWILYNPKRICNRLMRNRRTIALSRIDVTPRLLPAGSNIASSFPILKYRPVLVTLAIAPLSHPP